MLILVEEKSPLEAYLFLSTLVVTISIVLKKCTSFAMVSLLTHQQLLLLLPVESDDKEADPVLGQALPCPNEVHLCLQQIEVLHIGVGLKDLLTQLKCGYYL